METSEKEKAPGNGRRIKQPSNWKRNKEKIMRYSAKKPPQMPQCNHLVKPTEKLSKIKYHCHLLTLADVEAFHSAFYSNPEKDKQDMFILKYVKKSTPKQRRIIKERRREKTITLCYSFEDMNGYIFTICRVAFLSILQITKCRTEGLFKRFKVDGLLVPVETRGGWRKEEAYRQKRESVMNFIKNLKTEKACTKKCSKVYLSSDLTVVALSKMYNNSVPAENQVKLEYFRNIFKTHFNIGFRSPEKKLNKE